MKIEVKPIEAELQELAGRHKVTVRLDKAINHQIKVVNRDTTTAVFFNPSKIRSQKTLDEHLNMLRRMV